MPTRLARPTLLSKTDRGLSVDMPGETVILDRRTGTYFGVSAVGASVWSLLQTPRTVGQLIESVTAEFEVDPTTCERDLMVFLGSMISGELIEVRDAVAA